MSEKVSNINLDAHYTSNPKVERPARVVITGPETLPKGHLYNDIDAKKRLNQANTDIYDGVKTEKKKNASKFWKIFIGAVLTILGIKGIQKLIRK